MKEKNDIFGIPLEKEFGFAYVQCVYTGTNGYMPNLLIKNLNYHSKILETSIDNLIDCEELCYPFLMMDGPLLRGPYKWKRIGVSNVKEEIFIPDLRQPVGGLALIENYDWANITWEIISDFNYTNPIAGVPYSSIRHLGLWRHSSPAAIRQFLSMFWLKKLGVEIRKIYTEEEIFGKGNFWTTAAFHEAENLVFYSDIHKKYWGRVIPPSGSHPLH
ncbi:MAG: hypothetical protein J0H74_02645 [Chitinophagaceae bacterium]|nr:hypothetical protein [Chitinophagaceae bacterium]